MPVTTLKSLSDDFAALVSGAAPSIVLVDARKRYPATGIVWSADGLILTAAHVVTREEQLRVGLPDGTTVPAQGRARSLHGSRAAARRGGRIHGPPRGSQMMICAWANWSSRWDVLKPACRPRWA